MYCCGYFLVSQNQESTHSFHQHVTAVDSPCLVLPVPWGLDRYTGHLAASIPCVLTRLCLLGTSPLRRRSEGCASARCPCWLTSSGPLAPAPGFCSQSLLFISILKYLLRNRLKWAGWGLCFSECSRISFCVCARENISTFLSNAGSPFLPTLFSSANCPISEMGTELRLCAAFSTSCLKTQVYIIR